MPQEVIPCEDCAEWRHDLARRGFTFVSCAPVPGHAGFCAVKWEEPLGPGKQRALRSLAGATGVRGKVEMSRSRKVPRRIFDIESRPSKAAPRRIAEAFLRKVATRLGIARDLSDLRFDKVKESILGKHVLFQQYLGRTQISGAWVRVDIDEDGRVYNLQNDLVPASIVEKASVGAKRPGAAARAVAKPISESAARAAAVAALADAPGRTREVLKSELLYRPAVAGPKLAWKMVVRTTRPSAEWKMYLDAATGALVWRRNVLKQGAARGRVFDPNPVVALNDTALRDTSLIPSEAYREVELPDVASSGYLDGPFVSTAATRERVRKRNRLFLLGRHDRGFKEVMVYFHVDRIQRHLQRLGFENILHRAVAVNVAGQRDDNSFYSPTTKALSFGTGGVDDAEDAEIILHEYGHAIQDDQVPGFGDDHETAAMGEGFGDFLAASFFADNKPARLRAAIGSWDAVFYSADNPPCLRRLDSNKKYPKDLTGEEHDDGEIWSACLWELRGALGRDVAERLVIAHHFLLNRWASFEDAASAMLTTDQRLFGGRNATQVREVFVRRGILPNPARRQRRAGTRFNE